MFEQYSLVEQIAIGTYQYTRPDNTMDPPQFCSHFYRRGTIFAFNESFIFDPTIDHGMLLLYAHHLLIKHVWIMNLFFSFAILLVGHQGEHLVIKIEQ